MRPNGKWLMILGVCAALLYVESDQVVFAHGTPHVIPLVPPQSNSIQQGFIRVVNRTNLPGEVSIYAIDDTGERFGPIFLSLSAKATVHLNSGDLERGNTAKGLSSGVGDGEGNWWLELHSELDIEPLGYIRTGAGFVTSMHDVVAEETTGHYRVPIFNPASNSGQQSRLRLINPADGESEVTITGVDDAGMSAPGGDVHLTLAAGEARTITAQQLESGDDDLTGRLGDGAGKWTLFVSADQSIQVMSLMLSGDGNLSNLSRTPYYETHGAPTVSLRIADAGASEGEPLVFTVTLDLTPASTETYYYATYGATAGSEDYTGHSATELEFAAGEQSSTITVRTTQDAQVEGDEAFYVYVTNSPGDLTASTPTSYLARATGTIRDDDVDIAAACPGSTVSIPDSVLRSGIEHTLGKAPGAPITPAEMATVTRLRYSSVRLSSLTGLECATGLTSLEVHDTQITDVSPLAGLLALQRLSLYRNQITDVSLTGLPALEDLNLISNQITDVSLTGLPALEDLRLGSNQITDVSLAGLPALEYLYLSNNQITDVSLTGLPALQSLGLESNQITDVSPLAGLTALQSLSLSSNQITDVSPLAGLTALQSLYLPYNQITDIAPLVANMGLGFGDTVYLQNNPLSTDSLNTHIPALEARGVSVSR